MATDAPRDPEELSASSAPIRAEIDPATRMGAVHLTVADLGSSVAYYTQSIGLTVKSESPGTVVLGSAGADLLSLVEVPDARPADGHSGLYHFALLVPERADLARWLAHAARDKVQLTGLSDHFVSEAIYLNDPDRHGIEIYWDRPRTTWEGQVAERLTSTALDVTGLLGELPDPTAAEFGGLPDGTTMGHVHLRVADVTAAVAFYRDVLGFGLMAEMGQSAAFLSAGGYHHHLGANIWESRGAGQGPAGSAKLTQVTVVLPDEAARNRAAARVADSGQEPRITSAGVLVTDPSGNPVALVSA